MPEQALREAASPKGLTEKSFAALAAELSVSPSALAYRLENLRLVDAGTRDRFQSLSGARAAHLAGRSAEFARLVSASGTPRAPGLLVRDTYAAYDSGAATLRPYANLIGADVDQLRDALESDSETIDAT